MSHSLFPLWTSTVGRSPASVALVEASSGRKWSRRALAEGAREWADAYSGAVRKGATWRVAMSVPNGAEWFHVFLGLLSVRAVPVPIDPSEPDEAQVAAAVSIGARFLWKSGRLHPLPAGRSSARRPPVRDECLVKMTSGSSGAPKGLPVTHAQMAADGRQICASMGIRPDDVNLAAIPLGYSYGLGNLVLPLIAQGTRVVCCSSALPHAIASDAARFRPTVFPSVPPLLAALVASALPPRALSSLRLVISAGSPLSPEVARAFAAQFGVRVHGFYGTSETGGIAYDRTGAATLDGRSVGTPLDGVRITLGPTGRLSVASAAVLGRGLFSPADRASLNPEGELVLRGRRDRVVKVAGRRVDLGEIEAALRSVPGVHDAQAHQGPGERETLGAAVATALSAGDVRLALRRRLASWKIPARIVAMAALPATARGKTDARKIRQLLSAPRTATSISTFKAERQISARR